MYLDSIAEHGVFFLDILAICDVVACMWARGLPIENIGSVLRKWYIGPCIRLDMGAGDVGLYDTTQEYGNSMSLLRSTGVEIKGYTSSN